MATKTVLVTSFHTLISRNIVSTPALSLLVKRGWNVIILVPDFKRAYFLRRYAAPGITIEGVYTGPSLRTRRVGMFKRFAEALPQTARARLGRRRTFSGAKKSRLLYFFFYAPAGFLGRFFWFARLIRFLDYWLSPAGRFALALERHRPDLVFATDVQNEHDVALLQDARRQGIRTVAMVRSWDNLTTRMLRFVPDLLLAPNDIIASEAMMIDRVPAAAIAVTGIPHYDRYAAGPTRSRSDFLVSIGADPAKKLIVYAPICDYRMAENSADRYILELLSELDAAILVRFPPAETVSLGDFKKPPHMIFDRPGYVFDPAVVGNRDLTPEDEERFLNAMAWSDVVVCGPSTIILDAVFFDKPVICVDLYPEDLAPEDRIWEYGAEHIQRVFASGAVRRPASREEFFSAIRAYLENPALDRDGRRRLRESHCGARDGRASERLAAALDEFASLPQKPFKNSLF